jgi:hypothetical protein
MIFLCVGSITCICTSEHDHQQSHQALSRPGHPCKKLHKNILVMHDFCWSTFRHDFRQAFGCRSYYDLYVYAQVKLLPDTLVYQDKLALWTGKEGHGK